MENDYFVGAFAMGAVCGALTCYIYVKMSRKSVNVEEDDDDGNDNIEDYNTRGGRSYRLIIGVRTDLGMQKGKVAAQVAHAAVASYVKASKVTPKAVEHWTRHGQAKITVKISCEEEMMDLKRVAREMGVLTCIIRDAGHTQVEPDSKTVIAFGPAPKDVIDKLTGHLKLY